MSRIGYARVSSVGQSLEVQLDKLSDCDKVFSEKRSGATAQRPEWNRCKEYLRDGDTLVITKLDRLARSMFHLVNIAKDLEEQGIDLVVIDQGMDTTTPEGKALFGMLAVFAEFEYSIRAERQKEGIVKAKENGVKFGRKVTLTSEQADEMRQRRKDGVMIKELMKDYSLSKSSVYRYLKVED